MVSFGALSILLAYEPISYQSHYNSVRKCFHALGFKFASATHCPRQAGAIAAETAGVNEASIRRQGRWNQQAMEGCYLTGIPVACVRGMAGFDPNYPSFFLERNIIQPPTSLQKKVYPELDFW
jgi:hypothetical protein